MGDAKEQPHMRKVSLMAIDADFLVAMDNVATLRRDQTATSWRHVHGAPALCSSTRSSRSMRRHGRHCRALDEIQEDLLASWRDAGHSSVLRAVTGLAPAYEIARVPSDNGWGRYGVAAGATSASCGHVRRDRAARVFDRRLPRLNWFDAARGSPCRVTSSFSPKRTPFTTFVRRGAS